MRPCQHSGAHHSDDRVEIYHGSTTPTILCGYHASWGLDGIATIVSAS